MHKLHHCDIHNISYYISQIESLESNDIFVYGSNTQGKNGSGSAWSARNRFNAVDGIARGISGRCYAICTKDLTKSIHPSISLDDIKPQVIELYEYAESNPQTIFYIAYTYTPKELPYRSGYSPIILATQVFRSYDIPANIIFESGFAELVYDIVLM